MKMDKIESFSEAKNMARVAKGFKEAGTYFRNANQAPAMDIGAGYPAEVEQKLEFGKVDQATPVDPWNVARISKL